jgi:hypothetical protein
MIKSGSLVMCNPAVCKCGEVFIVVSIEDYSNNHIILGVKSIIRYSSHEFLVEVK